MAGTKKSIVRRRVEPVERIDHKILVIRGQKVIIDADLAALYGVSTKALNQAVKRNQDRFPDDFAFRLTSREKGEVVTICDHLAQLKYSSTLPNAFTEHGALMAASVLNSPLAIEVSIQIVRAFVRLRQILASNEQLRRKLDALEKRYDEQFAMVFEAIRQLMDEPDSPPKPPIGYESEANRR